MGRRRKGLPELSPDVLKRKHRNADTKYRSKVQCLYKVLKGELSQPTTKDNLLKLALNYIKLTEDQLSNAVGTKEILNNVRAEFLSLLLQEADIWNIEKNVETWWLEAQNLLHDKCETMPLHDIPNHNETKCSLHGSDKENSIKDIEQVSENFNSNSLSNSTEDLIDDSRRDTEQSSVHYSENSMSNSTVGFIIDDSSTSNQREQDPKFACSDRNNNTCTFNFHDTFKMFKCATNEDNSFAKTKACDCFYINDKDCHQFNQNGKNVVSVSVQDKHLFASEIEGNKAIPVSETNNLGLSSTTCFVLQ